MSATTARIFWVSLIFLVPSLAFLNQPLSIGTYDEAIVLTGAIQVQQGRFPGSEFFSIYGPLQFFIAAAIMEVFGHSILPLRLYNAVLVAVTLLALVAALRPTRSRDVAAIAILLLSIAFVYISRYGSSLYPTHSLPVFAALFVLAQRRTWSFSASVLGLVTFLTAVIALTPVSGFILLVMLCVAIPFQLWNKDALNVRTLGRDCAKLALAATLAAAVLTSYDLISGGSMSETIMFLLNEHVPVYATHRALPFPTFSENSSMIIPAYFPILTFVCGAGFYFYTSAKRKQYSGKMRTTLFWLLFFCLAFYPNGIVRTHGSQLWGTLIFALAAATHIVMHLRLRKPQKRTLSMVLLPLAVLYVAEDMSDGVSHENTILGGCNISALGSTPASCLQVGGASQWPERQDHIAFLQDYLDPGEGIFVANPRHDMIFAGDMTYYFLLNRMPWTHWAHMEPGIQTELHIQQDIIADLQRQVAEHGRAVVLIHPAEVPKEPNQSAISSGETALDDHLANCTLIKDWPLLSVLECKA